MMSSHEPKNAEEHMIEKKAETKLRLLATTIVVLLVIDCGLALAVVKQAFYRFSLTISDYLFWVSDEFAVWTGRVFWTLVIVLYVLLPIVRGGTVKVPELSHFLQDQLNKIGRTIRNRAVAIGLIAVLAGTMVVLTIVARIVSFPLAPPPAGVILAPTNPNSTKLFAVVQKVVVKLDRNQTGANGSFIPNQIYPLSDAGNISEIIVDYDLKRLYATDNDRGVVHVVDTDSATDVQHISVGKTAGPIALSGDGEKLYVGVVGPTPPGQIQVFRTRDLSKIAVIGKVGCPVDFYAASRAPLLFVATQCGGGHDPLYIVDTRNDTVKQTIPDLAVGSKVVATPDGRIAFVSTGDKLHAVRNGRIEKTIEGPVGVLAITSDGDLVLMGSRLGIQAIDATSLTLCRRVDLEDNPSGIAVTPAGAVYALLPKRIFVSTLDALKCH